MPLSAAAHSTATYASRQNFRPGPTGRGRLYVVPTDRGIIARCQAGDEAAFGELFDEHYSDVSRIIYRMIGPSPDLEDLVQDVFLQVFRSIGRFQGNSRFSTWLYRVSVNVVLMYRRSARSRPVLVAEALAEPAPAAASDPEQEAIRRKRIQAFFGLLDRLSEKKRVVFVLHELEGLPPQEIAEIVGAPLLTVRTRLFYARRDIERLLGEVPELEESTQSFRDRGAAS